MSGGESSPIVAVGGMRLPAMRLSGLLTVGAIRDAAQELRDSSRQELRRLLAGFSRAHKAGRYYRYRYPGSQARDNDQDGHGGPSAARGN